MPHYSLQNDTGPKVIVSCGTFKETDAGDSLNSIHYSMRDMVHYLETGPYLFIILDTSYDSFY